MSISVDVPEPIGFENNIFNFTFFQMSRIIIYSIPIIYFSIVFSPLLIIFIPIPFILMKYKMHGLDFDIFILSYLKWKIFKKILESEKFEENFIIQHDLETWKNEMGLNAAISVEGIGIDFFDEESKNTLYESYCKFINGIDFPLYIYIYSIENSINLIQYVQNPILEKIAKSQYELIKNLKTNFSKKLFIIILNENYFKSGMDIEKSKKKLEENVNYVKTSLESMGLKCKRISFEEYNGIMKGIL